jgi:ubiquinone/menaquinone biosynthesis C-methylase UbiE
MGNENNFYSLPNVPKNFVAGNHFDKYRSNNKIYKYLLNNFINNCRKFIKCAHPVKVLEIGCGPGDFAFWIFNKHDDRDSTLTDYIGVDVSREVISEANSRYPHRNFVVASAYALPFEDESFDFVIACEVLEHLERPDDALREIERVCKDYLLVSVPREPLWSSLNMLRGKYIMTFGNTPGHVQNFTIRAVRKLVQKRFKIVEIVFPIPWTLILARR